MEFEVELKLSSPVAFLLGVGLGLAVGLWAGSRRLGGLLAPAAETPRDPESLGSRAW